MKTHSDIRFAFFGTSHIATQVLDELEKAGLLPQLVITPPPKPKGRGLEIAQTDVANWARKRELPLSFEWGEFERGTWDVAVVVDYGKILPQRLLEVPARGFLNVHPSLLPHLRGPSPIRSTIMHDERKTGVSIILLDDKMDHGPIVAQKPIEVTPWPPRLATLETQLLMEGGELLARILPLWVHGEIEAHPQNDDLATLCAKFTKEDGHIDLSADPYQNLLKIRALEGWPGTYAYFERAGKRIRTQILDAHLENDSLSIDTVKPEGKNAMPYADFVRSGAAPCT